MPREGIARAVAPVLAAIPTNNPAPATEDDITELLHAAWEGSDPS
nr:hypothetical protein [Streptomyces sp. TP-A0874]